MTLKTNKTSSFILHDDLWLALTEAAMLAAPEDFGLGVNDLRYLQGPVISPPIGNSPRWCAAGSKRHASNYS